LPSGLRSVVAGPASERPPAWLLGRRASEQPQGWQGLSGWIRRYPLLGLSRRWPIGKAWPVLFPGMPLAWRSVPWSLAAGWRWGARFLADSMAPGRPP